ncbi:MAG: hypothetical protein IBJ03_04015 [Gemmatimonadaceae bacterium]|nr:hypothetical protein [Gemmatimonadaceae bacterium]
MPTYRASAHRLRLFATALTAAVFGTLTGCGAIAETTRHVIQVDRVELAAPTSGSGYARVTFHGIIGNDSCAELSGVERSTTGTDTVSWRFIATRGGNNCFQAIKPLQYIDSVLNQPARTFHVVVHQPTGDPLRQSFTLPVANTN